MFLDNYIQHSPAKINLFLKVLNKRSDNFHNIRSGVTIINLFDEIEIKESSNFEIRYIGRFAPKDEMFKDCIIKKLFKTFDIKKPKIKLTIKKNIPVQSGLGSGSSNAASIFKILEKLNIYKLENIFDSSIIGTDIPIFLNNKDCLVTGKGDKITNLKFPKYFFLLVKPITDCSTKDMYSKIKINQLDETYKSELEEIQENDNGNDFENYIRKNNSEIENILDTLNSMENVIFSRLTGSGSCCFAVFVKKEDALLANIKFQKKHPSLWSCVVENNN